MIAHEADIVRVNAEHPDWTAKQVAEHLSIERYHVYNAGRLKKLTFARAPSLPIATHKNAIARIESAPPVTDFTVYANRPADMEKAQASMIEWCTEKVEAEKITLAEAERNLTAALDSGFGENGWERQVKLVRQKVEFYTKVMAALECGYYIVPPFPLDVFAIRTKAHVPRGQWKDSQWSARSAQSAAMLPMGEGRYVDPEPHIETMVDQESDGKGGTKMVRYWRPDEFTDVDFPFKLARAEILSATQAAMALRLFDRMGALPARPSADPIVCGQILMPHHGREPLTFFVSWWLDTRTL